MDRDRDAEESDEYTMYRVSSGSTKPLMVTVKLNGVDIEMWWILVCPFH